MKRRSIATKFNIKINAMHSGGGWEGVKGGNFREIFKNIFVNALNLTLKNCFVYQFLVSHSGYIQ